MDDPTDNLLLRIHNLAYRQDENFHTEVLVHLLRYLVKYEPAAAEQILRKITCENLNLTLSNEVPISINTRVRTPKGYYPDIEIRTDEYLVYIEVKVGFEPNDLQLENYRVALNDSKVKNTSLILLTKFPITEQIKKKCDAAIRWYQIFEWVEHELERGSVQKAVSEFIIKQFLEFLSERGISLKQVDQSLIAGIKSLRNLLDMLYEALILMGIKPKIDSSEDDYGYCSGYYFKYDSGEYWIGIEYDWPEILLFVTLHEIDVDAYRKLEVGRVNDGQWIYKMDLSKEIEFFELSKSAQLQRIEQFLKDSFNAVKQLPL